MAAVPVISAAPVIQTDARAAEAAAPRRRTAKRGGELSLRHIIIISVIRPSSIQSVLSASQKTLSPLLALLVIYLPANSVNL